MNKINSYSNLFLKPDVNQALFLFFKNNSLKFKSFDLAYRALIHKSYNENPDIKSNERLEFLGDSVLNLIICEYLYLNFFDHNEGDLSKMKSFIVSEENLYNIALKIGLNEFIIVGKSENKIVKSIIADSLEALIGAYFLDSGLEKVKKFVLDIFKESIKNYSEIEQFFDIKSKFQTLIQQKYKICPKYKLMKKEGPEHNLIFFVDVYVSETLLGSGLGNSKKEAEKQAAMVAYKNFLEKFS